MAEYLKSEPEREKAKRENLKRKIEEKLELADRPTRKHRFEDAKFFDESEEQVEEVKSAVAAAIKESMKAGAAGVDSKGKGKAKEVVVEKKKAPAKSLGMWYVSAKLSVICITFDFTSCKIRYSNISVIILGTTCLTMNHLKAKTRKKKKKRTRMRKKRPRSQVLDLHHHPRRRRRRCLLRHGLRDPRPSKRSSLCSFYPTGRRG